MITTAEIETFVEQVQKMQNEYFARNFASLDVPTISYDLGRKNVRIVTDNGVQRSVFCFVERETGNILKSASWATPAKGARGHISNGVGDLTPYGAKYLR